MKRTASSLTPTLAVLSFATLVLVTVPLLASAHIMMSSPAPRQSKENPGPGGQIDFDYTSPLGRFPCKGYPAQAPVLTVAAGGSIPITLTGGATHDGGHCQFALSYDGDQTFVVIDTIIRECLRRGSPFQTTVTIPASAPSGKATLAWGWLNAVGNREYYMSCSDIEVTGGSGPSGSLSGPELLVAHLPGFTQFSFPEFPGNAPDNREAFAQRRQITVRGNGSGGGGGGGGAPSIPAPRPTSSASTPPVAQPTVPVIPPPRPTIPVAPQPRPTIPAVPQPRPTIPAPQPRPTIAPTPPPTVTPPPVPTRTVPPPTVPPPRPTRTSRPRPGNNLQDPPADLAPPPSNDLAPPRVVVPAPRPRPTPTPPSSLPSPPRPPPVAAQCTVGDMRCDTDVNFFLQCEPSGKFAHMPVPRDTTCGLNARSEVEFVHAGPAAPGTK